MVKNLLIRMGAVLMLAVLFGAVPAVAQEEGLYIEEWSFTPGGEMDYFTIGL